MQTILARNVSEALVIGMKVVKETGILTETRNGPAYVLGVPAVTIYEQPTERVLMYPVRDANPFFHFMEGLWMIAGRNDVEWISRFNASIANYSDDGKTFHGAYGYRWRQHFGFDQLEYITELLKDNPEDRRIVLQMWDPKVDLGCNGKDFPCNTAAKFRISRGKLDMTVENRSNDMVWGAYGANAVHFSMLQEYMAAKIGVPVGAYWQFTTNYHAYLNTFEKCESLLETGAENLYANDIVAPYPMVNGDVAAWEADLRMFMDHGSSVTGYIDPFFRRVAVPLEMAWKAFKNKEHDKALSLLDDCAASDWRVAAQEWVERRKK